MRLKIIEVDNYADAEKKCPKGYRMLYDWELLKEIRTNKKSPLRYNGSSYRGFYALRTKEDIKEHIWRGLISSRIGSWLDLGSYGFDNGNGFAFGVYVKKGVNHD